MDFALRGKVRVHVERGDLADINAVFSRLERGEVTGRMVLGFR
jgi:D-arabinose 1-dehydrogenase-like Zn-dependent alcohol dehydrogenase